MRHPTPTDQAYSELQRAYDFYNQALFESRLPACLFTLQRQKRTFGYFSKERFGRRDGSKTDEIAINPEYFGSAVLLEVFQTLVHEMVHLWQSHFGTPSRACYHNREWADKMQAIGLMPSSTGKLGGKKVGQHMSDYVISGGKFERVTNELRNSGFEITWFDRYPALTLAPTAGLPGLSATSTTRPKPPSGHAIDTQEPNPLMDAPFHTQPELFLERANNRSNRIKYTCPGCRNNAWGKPKLKLICGECNVPLAESAELA